MSSMYSRRDNNNNTDLIGRLEEFGLSRYEAGAYITMIGKGSLGASEIAYYANLPRTKVYPILKRLEKKKLSVISQRKPLVCSAIPPEEAFTEIVNLYEQRLKDMRKVVDKLQRINNECQRPNGSEERRYFILDPNAALHKIEDLIANSKSTIYGILDIWGTRLICQCKPSIVKALINGVKIKLILSSNCVENESLFSLPEDIDLKIGDVFSSNIMIIDSNMVTVDSNSGKAAVFTSMDIFGSYQVRDFEDKWSNSFEVKTLTNTRPSTVLNAFKLHKAIQYELSTNLLCQTSRNSFNDSSGRMLMVAVEKAGIKVSDLLIDEMFKLIDTTLKMCYSGELKYDKTNNLVSIQSKSYSKPILPWAFLLASYFKHIGNDAKIIQSSKHNYSTSPIHIKLSKTIP